MQKARITVWNEYIHEVNNEVVAAIYPDGIHGAIARTLEERTGATVRTATLRQDADHGLSQEVIDATDVLFWWGHVAHAEVS
ncbi:MAG: trehalose utilization protein ThuA, partial [Trueperaceae bacterium]